MKQNKRTAPAELSYYGLYLLDYLRKYHPDKVLDTEFITCLLYTSPSPRDRG